MVGFQAGFATATSTDNTYVGGYAGRWQTGTSNTSLGAGALFGVDSASDADNNTAIGYAAMRSNRGSGTATGNDNVAVGANALQANTTGRRNTIVGAAAGYTTASADEVVYVGRDTGYYQTGSTNTAVGS